MRGREPEPAPDLQYLAARGTDESDPWGNDPHRSFAFVLYASRHLLDYGWFLFLGSVLLLWPVGLLVFLVVSGFLQALYVGAQIVLSWRSGVSGGSRVRDQDP